jgi:hypothetical protein
MGTVIRMARSLAKRHGASKEAQFSAEFESADLAWVAVGAGAAE